MDFGAGYLDWPRELRWAAGGLTALAALWLARRLFRAPRASPHLSRRRCACGWSGEVSRYKPVCPRCAKPL